MEQQQESFSKTLQPEDFATPATYLVISRGERGEVYDFMPTLSTVGIKVYSTSLFFFSFFLLCLNLSTSHLRGGVCVVAHLCVSYGCIWSVTVIRSDNLLIITYTISALCGGSPALKLKGTTKGGHFLIDQTRVSPTKHKELVLSLTRFCRSHFSFVSHQKSRA